MQDFLDTLTISSSGNSAFRDTGEEWEPLSKTWKTTEMKTHAGMSTFGAIAINFDFVCPN